MTILKQALKTNKLNKVIKKRETNKRKKPSKQADKKLFNSLIKKASKPVKSKSEK